MARQKGGERLGGRTPGGKGIERLTARQVSSYNKPGLYTDGGGLYLRVTASGNTVTKSWVFRYMLGGKATARGLGPVHTVSLAEAREAALQHRKTKFAGQHVALRAAVVAGHAPISTIKIPTFAELAESFISGMEPGWRDPAQGPAMRSRLARLAGSLGDMPVSAIETDHILAVLKPTWATDHKRMDKLQNDISLVMNAARRYRPLRDNPADWKTALAGTGLSASPEAREVKNREAMPFADLPAFMSELRAAGNAKTMALEFQILTAARPGMVAGNEKKPGMPWAEVDLAAATWTIPGRRMKNGKTHTVPLSDRAMVILGEMAAIRTGKAEVFPIGQSSVRKGLADLKVGFTGEDGKWHAYTVHGFRSSFRDWARKMNVAHDVSERCLSHDESSKTVKAYLRTDLLDERRPVMAAWADYCEGQETAAARAAA